MTEKLWVLVHRRYGGSSELLRAYVDGAVAADALYLSNQVCISGVVELYEFKLAFAGIYMPSDGSTAACDIESILADVALDTAPRDEPVA